VPRGYRNESCNISKARMIKLLALSGWIKPEVLVVECVLKFKGVALTQRMKETGKDRRLPYHKITRKNVCVLMREPVNTGNTHQPWRHIPRWHKWRKTSHGMRCRANEWSSRRASLEISSFTARNMAGLSSVHGRIGCPSTSCKCNLGHSPGYRLEEDLVREVSGDIHGAMPAARISRPLKDPELNGSAEMERGDNTEDDEFNSREMKRTTSQMMMMAML